MRKLDEMHMNSDEPYFFGQSLFCLVLRLVGGAPDLSKGHREHDAAMAPGEIRDDFQDSVGRALHYSLLLNDREKGAGVGFLGFKNSAK